MRNTNKYKSDVILDLSIDDDSFGFATSIDDALAQAEAELVVLNETVESSRNLNRSAINWIIFWLQVPVPYVVLSIFSL